MKLHDEGEQPAWKQFENVVVNIFARNKFTIEAHSPQGDAGYDFDAELSNLKWAIEVKYYRSARAQVGLIEAAAVRVMNNGLIAQADRAALVVSSFISPEQRLALEKRYSVTFVDRADLAIMASEWPDLADELNVILEARSDLSDLPRTDTGVADRFSIAKDKPRRMPASNVGRTLAERLRRLAAGRPEATQYEELSIEILKFLFGSDLVGWNAQNRTDDGLNRLDCICRVKPTHEFWRFIIEDLGSRYVVFEFKNYQDPISQGQVLTTEKYLLAPALRKVAFILTRNGADEGARKMAKGAMREHGKLMLILDDQSVIDMLEKRDSGVDPTDIMFDRADEFMLTLSR